MLSTAQDARGTGRVQASMPAKCQDKGVCKGRRLPAAAGRGPSAGSQGGEPVPRASCWKRCGEAQKAETAREHAGLEFTCGVSPADSPNKSGLLGRYSV